MKDIKDFINESFEIINEGKTKLTKCPGWTFDWIATKNKWASKGDPKIQYHLICIPDDKTKDIIVIRKFAWYQGGYDQGHASERQFYLTTLTGGTASSGSGRPVECEPMDCDIDRSEAEHLNCFLNGKKDWSDKAAEALEKAAITYDRKTKKSKIRQDLNL